MCAIVSVVAFAQRQGFTAEDDIRQKREREMAESAKLIDVPTGSRCHNRSKASQCTVSFTGGRSKAAYSRHPKYCSGFP